VIAGDTEIIVLYLEQADGTALTYASKALFEAAGFAITWYDNAAVALSSQPTWTLPVAGSSGRHQFAAIVPDGAYTWKVTEPSTHISTPCEGTGEGMAYDDGSIGSILASSVSVTISPTQTSTTAEMFDGDSILIEGITIPAAALTAIGASSLANCDSRKAFIKLDSSDANDAPTVPDTDLTVTATTDSGGVYVVKVTKDAFPAAIGVIDDTKATSCTLHVRLTKGSKTIIAGEVKLTVKWPADQGDFTP
jgi:hypothetical protein